jgi:endonuclease/exonuclease/phosphatase (EEP) superfamily protein YafD
MLKKPSGTNEPGNWIREVVSGRVDIARTAGAVVVLGDFNAEWAAGAKSCGAWAEANGLTDLTDGSGATTRGARIDHIAGDGVTVQAWGIDG